MLSTYLTFAKFKELHRLCNRINIEYNFSTIIEHLLYDVNPIKYQYEDDTLKLIGNSFTISSKDGLDVEIEINLATLKKNEILLNVEHHVNGEKINNPNNFNWDKKTDIKDLSNKEVVYLNDENLIYEDTSPGYIHSNACKLNIYLKDNTLKFVKNMVTTKKSREKELNLKNQSSLNYVLINDILNINIYEYSFIDVIKKLEEYKIPYEMRAEVYYIRGHCIEDEVIQITTKDFKLTFHCAHFLEAFINSKIVGNCYFITTKKEKHNMGEILVKELKNKKDAKISGYGADDAWHYGSFKKDNYAYSLGYCI